jgi:hypothetical protein
VTFEEINNAISTSLGSVYINDFPNRGRMQRVIVQADRNARMQPDQILTYNVRNSSGQPEPGTQCGPTARDGRSVRYSSVPPRVSAPPCALRPLQRSAPRIALLKKSIFNLRVDAIDPLLRPLGSLGYVMTSPFSSAMRSSDARS